MLHVYYKEKTGMRYRTDIRFGIEDFICNFFFLTCDNNYPLLLLQFITIDLKIYLNVKLFYSRNWWSYGSWTRHELHQRH